MRLHEIITEHWDRNHKNKKSDQQVWVVGNEHAKIARTAKDAVKMHKEKDNGIIDGVDARINLQKVRDMYGMQLVDDFLDVLELPNAENDTDKEMSMFSKDNR